MRITSPLGFAATLLVASLSFAQSGPDLMVRPFPKDNVLEMRGEAFGLDDAHIKKSGEDFTLGMYDLEGRYRISPGERVDPRTRGHRTHVAAAASLPDGTFVLRDGDPYLVLGPDLLLWSPSGYAARRPRPPRGQATVITPPSLVDVLRAGWTDAAVPLLHPTSGV